MQTCLIMIRHLTYYPNVTSSIEGATDFLLFIMIIGISKLGFDIGTSAIILNSVGFFSNIISFPMFYLNLMSIRQNYFW